MVIFVLNWKPHNPHGQKYRKLVHQHCGGAWLAKCPPLRGTGVDGESKYHVELLIVPSTKLTEKMRSGTLFQVQRLLPEIRLSY